MDRMASGALAQPNRAVPSGRFSSARFVAPGFRGLAGIVGLLVLVALWYLASYVATPSVVPLPHTVIACIGPSTAFDARAAGLPVHVTAEERTTESLVAALEEYAAG